jgi:hypothetical protein
MGPDLDNPKELATRTVNELSAFILSLTEK